MAANIKTKSMAGPPAFVQLGIGMDKVEMEVFGRLQTGKRYNLESRLGSSVHFHVLLLLASYKKGPRLMRNYFLDTINCDLG